MEKLKAFLKLALGWLKRNWLTVLIVVGIILLAVNAYAQFNKTKSYLSLLDNYHQQTLDHQQQLKDLQTLVDNERQERDRILQEYLEEMNRIETEYKEALGKISQEREETQDDIIRNHGKDPTTLTTAVIEIFGIPLE